MSVIDRFMRYVVCPSESGQEEMMYHLLENELIVLGFAVQPCVAPGCALTVPNLYAHLDGAGEPLLFVAHMDTVKQNQAIIPYRSEGFLRSKGDCILGADDKSGIAAIMAAAARIVRETNNHPPIEILFTVEEEIGLRGSSMANYDILQSHRAYVFDSSADFGSLIVNSPHILQLRLEVTGKAAHAAIHPEQGIHALLAANDIIHALNWGRISEASTMNVGNFIAEGASNVICEHAVFELEIRSFLHDEAEFLEEKIRSIAVEVCEARDAQLAITELSNISGFSIAEDAPLLDPICHALRRNRITPKLESSYGGSDANMLNKNGIPAINISTGMRASHSSDECIKIEDLEALANVIALMMHGKDLLSDK